MAWIVKLVSIGAAGVECSTEVMRIARPDDLTDLATLGLALAEGKQLLAGVQQELVAAQARLHAARRPACRSCCSTTCRVKDYRQHAIFEVAPVWWTVCRLTVYVLVMAACMSAS